MLQMAVDIETMRDMIRVTSPSLDAELESLKEAYLHELSIAGVKTIPPGDYLAIAGLRLYLRYQTNHNAEGERYYRMYSLTRDAMALSSEYGEV